MDGWRVRGSLGSDVGPHSRFKYGLEKVGTRLDTRDVSVLLSLQQNGLVTLRASRPGGLNTAVVIQGILQLVDDKLVFSAVPVEGYSGTPARSQHQADPG